MLIKGYIVLSLGLVDLSVKVFSLFESSFTLSSSHFSFHQLNLIFSIIEEFLLSLKLLV